MSTKTTSTRKHGPTLAEYVARTVAQAPPLTPSQMVKIGSIMRGQSVDMSMLRVDPEIIAAQREREAAEAAVIEAKEAMRRAMDGCHGCGLSRSAHAAQKTYGMGYHGFVPLTPDDIIDVALAHKGQILEAETHLSNIKQKKVAA